VTTIFVDAPFTATHQIEIAGELEAVHGHDFSCRVEIAVTDERDTVQLAACLATLLAPITRTDLAAIRQTEGGHPSAERIARHVFRALAAVVDEGAQVGAVTIRESPGCSATYR